LKVFVIALVLLLASCFRPDSRPPKYVIYLNDAITDTELLVDFGSKNAEKHDLDFASESILDKDVQVFFEASGENWFYRNLGLGNPNSVTIVIANAWGRIGIGFSETNKPKKLEEIFLEWKIFLDSIGHSYEIEATE